MHDRSAVIPDAHDRRPGGGDLDPTDVSAATPDGSGEPLRRTLILIALYAIPAVVVMRSITDNDIWMNIRAGQWIVAHGAVPGTDPFSIYGQGRPWVAYSWLFEVLVHGLHEWLGLAGIVVYRGLMSYAILAALHRLVVRREPRFVVATSLVGIAFFALLPLLNERTWLFTILFSTLTLDVILDLRRGVWTSTAWLLPLIYALWANVHIQFIYGLFLLALGCAAPLIDGFLGRADDGPRKYRGHTRLVEAPRARSILPRGDTGEPLSCASLQGRRRICDQIGDVQPGRRVAGIGLSDAMGMGHARPGRRGGLRARAAKRSLGLRGAPAGRRFVSGVARGVTSGLRYWRHSPSSRADADGRQPWRAASHSTGRVPSSSRRWWAPCSSLPAGVTSYRPIASRRQSRRTTPPRAAAVIEQRGYRGPLFNEYGWGSYLIWRLPALPVSIDGRADLHGPEGSGATRKPSRASGGGIRMPTSRPPTRSSFDPTRRSRRFSASTPASSSSTRIPLLPSSSGGQRTEPGRALEDPEPVLACRQLERRRGS